MGGEGNTSRELVGGIRQEPVPDEVAAAMQFKELISLSQQQVASDLIEECIGFMDILGATDKNMLFSEYCQEALQLSDDELQTFGGRGSSFRTMVQLKHVVSVATLLKSAIQGAELFNEIAAMYREPLDEDCTELLDNLVTVLGPDDLEVLVMAMENVLKAQFMKFAEPTTVKTSDDEIVVLNSGGMMTGFLDFAPVDYHGEEMALCDIPWFTDYFPVEIGVDMIVSTFKFLKSRVQKRQ